MLNGGCPPTPPKHLNVPLSPSQVKWGHSYLTWQRKKKLYKSSSFCTLVFAGSGALLLSTYNITEAAALLLSPLHKLDYLITSQARTVRPRHSRHRATPATSVATRYGHHCRPSCH